MRLNLLSAVFLLFISIIGLNSCLTPPSFNSTPEIGFVKAKMVDYFGGDSVYITTSFKDKEGDIGLSSDDFITYKDKYSNEYRYNYWINMYVKKKNVWTKIEFSGLSFNGAIAPIYSGSPKGPVSGDITYGLSIPNEAMYSTTTPIGKNDTIKFDIQLVDRALHVSNKIETNDLKLNLLSK